MEPEHAHVFGRWFHIPISDWFERRCTVPGCKASESSMQATPAASEADPS